MKGISLNRAKYLDNRAIYKYGIHRLILMENAGRAVAELVLKKAKPDERILILAGTGFNGGDGLVAGRHIYLAGRRIGVILVGSRQRCKDETIVQLRILENMGLKVKEAEDVAYIKRLIGRYNFIVDALLGIGLKGKVREPIYSLIAYLNSLKVKKVSVDIPSGLDADSGRPLGIALRADYTVTFVAPKRGMLTDVGRSYCGKLIVAGIGG